MDITVGGHICLDLIPEWGKGSLEAIKPGQLIEMDGIQVSTGGVVANTGLALKKLGTDVSLVGKIGNDDLGKIILDILNEYADDITENMIISKNEISSYTVVLNPPDTDRVFLHYPGTNNTFCAKDIPYKDLQDSKIYHFGYPPLLKKMYKKSGQEIAIMFEKTHSRGIINSMDMTMPDPESEAGKINWVQLLKNVLPYVDLFLPSFEEITYMLKGEKFDENEMTIELLQNIAEQLLEMGTDIVVIKLGEQGIYLQTGDLDNNRKISNIINSNEWSFKKILAPCYQGKEFVGSTGAGDAAIAGFLADFISGNSPGTVINTAAALGTYCIEDLDAISGIKHMSEVKRRINSGWERLPVKFSLEDWQYDKDKGIWWQ